MIHWTVHLKGGAERCLHAAVVLQDKMYCFGGDRDPIDIHIFNTVALCWRKLTPVNPGHLGFSCGIRGHTAALVEDTEVYFWGGHLRGEYHNYLYAFHVDAHKWLKPRVSGTVPEVRHGHSACVLGKVMFIYGGHTQRTGCTNDMYKLDTSTMVWALINTRGTPSRPSYGQSATTVGTKMFVFGGCGGNNHVTMKRIYYNTIRVFDTETDLWLSTPSAQPLPEGRYGHSAFTYDGELYICGGWNGETLNDVWMFSPETFSWKKVESKGKRPCPMYGMRCCVVGDHVIHFGGYKGDHAPSDELYILDFSPSLKTLSKLAVTQHGLDQSGLPHNVRWELAAVTTTST